MAEDTRQALLDEIGAQVRECRLCGLCEGRLHAVPGEGPVDAAVMFIGEGPGAAEDQQGRPFVGPAGQVLNAGLQRAGLVRAEVFITNIVKCRPPQSREPHPEEVAACRGYLDGQIALIRPAVVCLLGRPATQTLLDPTAAMNQVHGRAFERHGLVFMPLYHPAAALHNASLRQPLGQDFRALGELLHQRPTDAGG